MAELGASAGPDLGTRNPRESTVRGLWLMLLATAAFLGMSVCVKLLREGGMATGPVMFWRAAPGLLWIAPVLWRRGVSLRPEAPVFMALRCLFGLSAMGLNFYAVRALSIVQHNVLHLLQPVFVAVMAPLVLGERLRGLALASLGVAFVGALLVINPGSEVAHAQWLPALAGVAAALASGLAHLMVRSVTRYDPPELVVFYFAAVVTVLAGAHGLASGEIFAGAPGLGRPATVAGVAGMAALGLTGQLLMTRAYGSAQAPMVAVVAYSSIPLSFAFDALVWGAGASTGAVVGSVLMVVAGVLLFRARADGEPHD